ncbi:RNA polymerase sigma factor [Arsukibacterium sp.]|uniref:RNA polymerase sigma factor n=1 Tax=Arsukibacterium sp. TaxID=1977258 RepID=UPI002FD8F6C5
MQQAQLDLLVLALQAGDKRAFAVLYQHYQRDLYRFSVFLLGQPAAAEDLVHNVWLKVSKRIHRLQDPRVFTSWLYRAVRWEVLDYQKQPGQRQQSLEQQDGLQTTALLTACNSEPVNQQKDLAKALALLAANERLVLQLHYLHELELTQIALILDVPLGTVKSRLHRARQQMQQHLTA